MTADAEPKPEPPWTPKSMFQNQVNHLARLAQSPGWLDYARARAKELEADKSGEFVGLYAAVALRLKTCRNTDDQTRTKHP